MDKAVAIHFRDELRAARAEVLKDGESFTGIIHAVERLGSLLHKEIANLGKYEPYLAKLAANSALATTVPEALPDCHATFARLYHLVREARNSAMHQGAYARHLATNAIALALVLEDALVDDPLQIGDFMVRAPVCASKWQPLSFIRQTMLANSFSFLPVEIADGSTKHWMLVSDYAVASYLCAASDKKERERRLCETLGNAVTSGGIALKKAFVCEPRMSPVDVLAKCDGLPVVVCTRGSQEIVGIATPFDLL